MSRFTYNRRTRPRIRTHWRILACTRRVADTCLHFEMRNECGARVCVCAYTPSSTVIHHPRFAVHACPPSPSNKEIMRSQFEYFMRQLNNIRSAYLIRTCADVHTHTHRSDAEAPSTRSCAAVCFFFLAYITECPGHDKSSFESQLINLRACACVRMCVCVYFSTAPDFGF